MSTGIVLPNTADGIVKTLDILAQSIIENFPTGTELSRNELEAPLLRGEGQEDGRRPDAYGKIWEAAADLTDDSERKASFLLEAVNGFRRQAGLYNTHEVNELLKKAMTIIGSLTGNDRYSRLLSLGNYHGGLVYRMAGEYKLAAGCQLSSAAMEPDANKRAVSLFVVQVEQLNHAFVKGVDINHRLDELIRLRPVLSEKFDSSWVAGSASHIVTAQWLAGEEMDVALLGHMLTWINFWSDVALEIFIPFHLKLWETVEKNADLVWERHKDFGSSSMQDALFVCDLALARSMVKKGSEAAATKVLQDMNDRRCHHGGHFVHSVAQQELAALCSN